MKYKSLLFPSVLFILSTANLFSQETPTEEKRVFFSFGIRANTFLLSDFAMKNLPPARLQLNLDLSKHLRFEVQYGFNKTVADHQIAQTGSSGVISYVNYPTTNSTSLWSTGLFFMKKMDKVNFYFGARYGKAGYSDQQISYFGSGYTVLSNSGKIGMISVALGGEYFLARRFSIAGEFAFVHMKDTYTISNPSSPGMPDAVTINNLSETSLILRFYPF
ncbi:MAG: hypothetical protein ACXVC6_06010 [Bacteroidia bacterium]